LVPDLPWGEDSNSAEQQEQEREQEQRAVIVNADEVVKVLGEIERKEEEEDSATCKWQRQHRVRFG
jgi:predicted house-cleaning NTP pyrophosphatase (Maf/HAM1 superfamily)